MLKKEINNSNCEVINNNYELILKNNKNLTLDIDKNVDVCYISTIYNSNLIINVKHSMTIVFFTLSKNTSSKIKINISNRKTFLKIREVVVIDKEYVYKKNILINHNDKETYSDYKFFGYAIDNSSLTITLISKINKNMENSEAHQKIKLLTCGKASVRSTPELLIDEFKVRASHGNSIGQIDPNIVYYMQTRGISVKQAEWMIINGILINILLILEQPIRDKIIKLIKKKLVDHG